MQLSRVSHPDAAVTAVTTAFFSLAYPGKDPGSESVHLKTYLLPEASLDAGSFTGWGAWFADAIIKTSIARCLRHTEGDSPCCTDTSADIPAGLATKIFGREGRGEGEPFSGSKKSPSPPFPLTLQKPLHDPCEADVAHRTAPPSRPPVRMRGHYAGTPPRSRPGSQMPPGAGQTA